MSTGLKTHRITDPNDDTRFVDVDPYVIEGVPRALGVFGTNANIFTSTNISSGTDLGTGQYEYSITNAFESQNFTSAFSSRTSSTNTFVNGTSPDASTLDVYIFDGADGSRQDGAQMVISSGQLA